MKLHQLSLLGLLMGASCCTAADLYRVSGVVVDSRTNQPMAKAHVRMLDAHGVVAASLVTGAGGQFAFDLPEGKYDLTAGTRDLQQHYGKNTAGGYGTGIVAGPGQDTSNILFRWSTPGAISGKIVDQDGEPVRYAKIELLRSTVLFGKRQTAHIEWAHTNDLGEYRFAPIGMGSYYFAVTAWPWYSGQAAQGSGYGELNAAYATEYYPGTTDPARAELLAFAPGEEARADFTLTRVAGENLTVAPNIAPGQQCTVRVTPEGISGSKSYQEQTVVTPGARADTPGAVIQAVFRSLPPGRYTASATCQGNGSRTSASKAIQVNGVDTTVDLATRPEPVVSASVSLKHPAARPHGTLLFRLGNGNGDYLVSSPHPDGSYGPSDVPPGRYEPEFDSPDGYYPSEIHVTGADYRDGFIDMQEGETITIQMVASDELGHVMGYAVRDAKPVGGAIVVLAPREPSALHPPLAYQSDSDGSFDFPHTPAGDYLLYGTTDLNLVYTDPAAYGPLLAGAKAIRVETKGEYKETVTIQDAAHAGR